VIALEEDSMSETLERDGLTVTIIETPTLGDRSYLVDDGRSALVVDPQRDIDRVEQVLEQRGVALVAVAETHAHDDYVPGGLELARKHGVPYLVPCEAEVAYERIQVCADDVRQVSSMKVRTISTTGPTPHHVAFAVGRGEQPSVVFTGGSMLFGAVGRTDLVSDDLTEELTHQQYGSVRRLADQLPGGAAVLPTHGFGSFCSATPTSGTASTVEQQRTQNPALTEAEDEFVRSLLAGLDAYPAYYAHMAPLNLQAPAPVDLSPVEHADGDEIRERIQRGEWVVDLRGRRAFARSHLPGSLSFDTDGSMAVYLGWLIPWGTPLTLIGDSIEQVARAQRELVRIGIDRPAGRPHRLSRPSSSWPAADRSPASRLRPSRTWPRPPVARRCTCSTCVATASGRRVTSRTPSTSPFMSCSAGSTRCLISRCGCTAPAACGPRSPRRSSRLPAGGSR
jgi:hydroxyacylglutathione hydrolase